MNKREEGNGRMETKKKSRGGAEEKKKGEEQQQDGSSFLAFPAPTRDTVDALCHDMMQRALRVGARDLADAIGGPYMDAACRGDPTPGGSAAPDPAEAMAVLRQMEELLLEREAERLRGVPVVESACGSLHRPSRPGRRDLPVVLAISSSAPPGGGATRRGGGKGRRPR